MARIGTIEPRGRRIESCIGRGLPSDSRGKSHQAAGTCRGPSAPRDTPSCDARRRDRRALRRRPRQRSSPDGRELVREAEGRRERRTMRTRSRSSASRRVFAWTLNQLARSERRDVDLLLDAGYRLREAQADILRDGGDRIELERAREIEREALTRLERAAARLLGGSSSSLLPQVSSTLRTAAVSEEGRELLARGRFVDAARVGGLRRPRRVSRPPDARRRRHAQERGRDAAGGEGGTPRGEGAGAGARARGRRGGGSAPTRLERERGEGAARGRGGTRGGRRGPAGRSGGF